MSEGTGGAKVLVVDDDPHIGELLELYLVKEGFQVVQTRDGLNALHVLQEEAPDLVILDIMLPGLDGWQVCREVRKSSAVPVIMLSAKGESSNRILGLNLGADDYLVKPFDVQELVARVRAVLRRQRGNITSRQVVKHPHLLINLQEYLVTVGETKLELPPKEIELLYFLAAHPNRVFTREQLLENVWGSDFLGESRTVDVHIQRLRGKVQAPSGEWSIKTVWGIGYKFEVTPRSV